MDPVIDGGSEYLGMQEMRVLSYDDFNRFLSNNGETLTIKLRSKHVRNDYDFYKTGDLKDPYVPDDEYFDEDGYPYLAQLDISPELYTKVPLASNGVEQVTASFNDENSSNSDFTKIAGIFHFGDDGLNAYGETKEQVRAAEEFSVLWDDTKVESNDTSEKSNPSVFDISTSSPSRADNPNIPIFSSIPPSKNWQIELNNLDFDSVKTNDEWLEHSKKIEDIIADITTIDDLSEYIKTPYSDIILLNSK